ncbi:MAG: sensor histidine kinase [Deltaproteobacteria bacterium]|nr:MAG: sensor histidine kinase [Deltaproteobacteria bacterium]
MRPREPLAYALGVTRELRRLLTIAGPAVWLMVGVPVLVRGSPEHWRLWSWAGAYLAFAVSLWLSLRTERRIFLFTQTASVIALVLIMCDGFEGALLVLVALQLSARLGRRAGLLAVAAQSVALGAAIAVHWNGSAAPLLALPYLGFQLLAFFAAEGMERLEAARELQLENSRLEERLRISRELHDRLGHHLTALNLNLEVAARAENRQALEAARAVGKTLLQETRAAVAELREPERLDVCGALRTLAEELPGLQVHVTAPAALRLRDPRPALTVLRCAQEIVTNALRHAGTQNLWLELTQEDGRLSLSARDDGRGVSEFRAGNGLRGMRERVESAGGTLFVETAAGKGFSLRAELPVRGRP